LLLRGVDHIQAQTPPSQYKNAGERREPDTNGWTSGGAALGLGLTGSGGFNLELEVESCQDSGSYSGPGNGFMALRLRPGMEWIFGRADYPYYKIGISPQFGFRDYNAGANLYTDRFSGSDFQTLAFSRKGIGLVGTEAGISAKLGFFMGPYLSMDISACYLWESLAPNDGRAWDDRGMMFAVSLVPYFSRATARRSDDH
jgi:hypothetical protein